MEGTLVPLVLRLALAAVIFPHGAQKVLGWFGGPGLEGTLVLGLAVALIVGGAGAWSLDALVAQWGNAS